MPPLRCTQRWMARYQGWGSGFYLWEVEWQLHMNSSHLSVYTWAFRGVLWLKLSPGLCNLTWKARDRGNENKTPPDVLRGDVKILSQDFAPLWLIARMKEADRIKRLETRTKARNLLGFQITFFFTKKLCLPVYVGFSSFIQQVVEIFWIIYVILIKIHIPKKVLNYFLFPLPPKKKITK